ncbi:MAG: OmpH family outer membrane protein, partial [Sphingomicrobium sp.]
MKILIATGLLTTIALALPGTAIAQTAPILIVDTDTILSTCTACQSAQTQLRSRQTTMQTRAQTLQTQLQTEGAPIQKAFEALNGKQPDAALAARITAFQTRERAAQQEMQTA